jgi:hypothetical protein
MMPDSSHIIEKVNNLPNCYIFDIDGTLAIKGDRSPFDWMKVDIDTLNLPVAHTFRHLAEKHFMIILSGRDSVCREITEEWLEKHNIKYDLLIMRKKDDMTKDAIIKKGFYEEYIKGKYNIVGIFDDRNQVVEMWRSLDLPCYQVAYGDF